MNVNVGSLQLKNPGMVASGIMDETGISIARMLDSGAGAVVTKSIGMERNPGHPNPSFIVLENGYVNAMGLPNPGIEEFGEEMEIATKKGCVIGSIYASSVKDFAALAGKMEDHGASAIELNLSCPHAKGYGMEMGTDPDIVFSIVSDVKSTVKIPVFSKLTPNTHRLVDIGMSVQKADGDGIVAINTLKAMVISPEAKRPILSNKFGGLSGPAIKPVGVRAIYDLHAALDIPLIGVGGISTWRDAAEYIMAGASAYQVGSAIGTHGIDVIKKINKGLETFMKEYNYNSIKDMVGAAHE